MLWIGNRANPVSNFVQAVVRPDDAPLSAPPKAAGPKGFAIGPAIGISLWDADMAKGGSFAGSIRRQKVAVAVAGLVTPCVQFIGAGAAGGACERRRPGGELQQKLEPEIAGRTSLAARARRIRSA